MSALTRPARAEDMARLWPAVKSARIMHSAEELNAFREAAPWRVRVTDAGEAMVLSPWRAHLGTLAIRALWAGTYRIPELIDDVAAVARSQGFESVLSPLVPATELEPYRRAGMEPVEPIVALQGRSASVAATDERREIATRPALLSEASLLAELDTACFEDFWRYGSQELEDSMRREHVAVAEADGAVVGYCACSVHGTTATVARVAVAPRARRRGVGALLVADAAAFAVRSHAETLTLCTQESNEASRALYRSCTLIELSERYTLAIRGA